MATKTQGFAELEKKLAELGNKGAIRRTATRALNRAAEPVRDEWKRLVPVAEGDLRDSIKIGRAIKSEQRFGNRSGTVTTFVGIDESQDRRLRIYGPVQEFGNHNHPAQPAGRPAWEATKSIALENIKQTLAEEIVKTAGRQARKAAKAAAQ